MKPFRLACLATLAILFAAGCGGGSGNYFVIRPIYGPPAAQQLDTQTSLAGEADGNIVCDVNTDQNCAVAFQELYATAASDGAYFYTDAVGNGQEWSLTGTQDLNCEDGYGTDTVPVDYGQTVAIFCDSPTTYFQATPGAWIQRDEPSSITFKAPVNVFPTLQYMTASTAYETNGDVEWQGNPVSSSQTSITMAVPNETVGTHIVVFRNPTTNAIIGAGAYIVNPTPPNCVSVTSGLDGVSPDGKCTE